jgi:uncharacterized protein (TIGR02246 family)
MGRFVRPLTSGAETFVMLVTAIVFAIAASGFQAANAAPESAVIPTIHALLERSADAWNRGDLATFMRSYEPSPDTVYVSSHAVIHGYANIQSHYASAHPGAMGTLTFSDLAIRPLGADYAVVVARWHLALAGGKKPTGLFSLVLHRSAAGWRIITDHSP